MEIIQEALLSITVLLLAIMNVYNNKRIRKLELRVGVLIHTVCQRELIERKGKQCD